MTHRVEVWVKTRVTFVTLTRREPHHGKVDR